MLFFECVAAHGVGARTGAGRANVKIVKDSLGSGRRTPLGGDSESLPARIGHGGRRFGSTLTRCPEREAVFRFSALAD
jgi:hypothetical protein